MARTTEFNRVGRAHTHITANPTCFVYGQDRYCRTRTGLPQTGHFRLRLCALPTWAGRPCCCQPIGMVRQNSISRCESDFFEESVMEPGGSTSVVERRRR